MPTARVLLVDDSRIFRAALEASLSGEEDIEIVGSVFSGEKAIEFIRANPPDIVTLDVEMPGMDGLETLKAIRQLSTESCKEVGVIMVSAHTKHGADVTVQALRHGAFDFIAKPSGLQSEENLVQLRRHLTCKIRLFMSERGRQVMPPSPSIPTQSQQYRKNRQQTIQAIVVATSTGGPRALGLLLPDLSRCVDLPILIVQHMPPKFTKSLAESLSRTSAVPVSEAEDGERLEEKRIYLAPGGMHMILRREGEVLFLGLNEQPPENGCRPSADVLFRSTAAALRSGVLAIVLSGMGRDGTIGLGAIKRAGGYAIVQDESTSVVWGMPGSAVEAGLADEILPLGEIAAAAKAIVCTVNED